MIYKVAIFALLALMSYILFLVATSGRLSREIGDSGVHRLFATMLLILTVAFVVMIEVGVRMRGGAKTDALFWTHLCFAIPYFLLLVGMNFWFTGEKSQHHALLGTISFILYGGMLATGIPLVLRF